jgi:C-terminal processing protease CtpA/Prc
MNKRPIFALVILILTALACGSSTPEPTTAPPPAPDASATSAPTATAVPATAVPTALPTTPAESSETVDQVSNEPVFISGEIPYTSPFFVASLTEPMVLLEDQAGFVDRNFDFTFALEGQVIGPVELVEDGKLRYSLSLPSVPQGTFVDVDNNGQEDQGVQVFAVAYWTNTWGDTFLDERDAGGWSGAHASTIVNSERFGEIEGGILIVWAPDDQQMFPTGFGDDNELFTDDDPVGPIPAGYNLVGLDHDPFTFWKEPRPEILLHEGSQALNDYSELEYDEAFQSMFDKISLEYAFTEDKGIDWQALYDTYFPLVSSAQNDDQFYVAMKAFSLELPDAHVGISFNADVFVAGYGGSFGIRLAELSDSSVIVVDVLPDTTGAAAGIEVGAEIILWDGQPVTDALNAVRSDFGPYSTPHHERLDQLLFLTRYPVGTDVDVRFANPASAAQTVAMTAEFEVDTLFASIASFGIDDLALPIETDFLEDHDLAYVQIHSFLDDTRLMAHLWERLMDNLIENDIRGLIIDVRVNGGGSGGLASAFAGYFHREEFEFGRRSYFNDISGAFEFGPFVSTLYPGPEFYRGQVAVLIGPNCVSACEGFAYLMQQNNRATIIGHFPSSGAFGEVGSGQYELPGDYSMQFPTGRPVDVNGDLLIEGTGVIPDIVVPVTRESALGRVDAVLQAAIDELTN